VSQLKEMKKDVAELKRGMAHNVELEIRSRFSELMGELVPADVQFAVRGTNGSSLPRIMAQLATSMSRKGVNFDKEERIGKRAFKLARLALPTTRFTMAQVRTVQVHAWVPTVPFTTEDDSFVAMLSAEVKYEVSYWPALAHALDQALRLPLLIRLACGPNFPARKRHCVAMVLVATKPMQPHAQLREFFENNNSKMLCMHGHRHHHDRVNAEQQQQPKKKAERQQQPKIVPLSLKLLVPNESDKMHSSWGIDNAVNASFSPVESNIESVANAVEAGKCSEASGAARSVLPRFCSRCTTWSSRGRRTRRSRRWTRRRRSRRCSSGTRWRSSCGSKASSSTASAPKPMRSTTRWPWRKASTSCGSRARSTSGMRTSRS
jgi:hypothetical protein